MRILPKGEPGEDVSGRELWTGVQPTMCVRYSSTYFIKAGWNRAYEKAEIETEDGWNGGKSWNNQPSN